jgi:hypothetical protein
MTDITPEQEAVQTLSPYLDRLLDSFADELNASSRKRKAFFVFLFGGISGLAVKRGLTVEQAQAVAISLFYEHLAILPMDGLRLVGYGAGATAGETPWSYAARSGVEEFFSWQADPLVYNPSALRMVLDRSPDVDEPEVDEPKGE